MFPHYLDIFGLHIHPHLFFESMGYTVGFQVYLRMRKRMKTPAVPFEKNVWIIAGAILGALIGSKIVAWFDGPMEYWTHRGDIAYLFGGKTIVGGFIGGWLGVEAAKKFMKISFSTGDPMVFGIIAGTCLGRVGCFLTGLSDHTYGIATTLPWGVDFGDGVMRHPTQVYEIVYLLLTGVVLFYMRTNKPNGWLFRAFMLAYFAFRVAVEFIKPRETPYLGLSGIQVAALIACVWCAVLLRRSTKQNTEIRN